MIDSFLWAHTCANLLPAAEKEILLKHGEPWVTLHKLSSPLHLLQKTPSVALKVLHGMTVFLTSPPHSVSWGCARSALVSSGLFVILPLSDDHLLPLFLREPTQILSFLRFPHLANSFHLAQQNLHCIPFLPVPNTLLWIHRHCCEQNPQKLKCFE